jgi:magnesium-transporting ATPase (P-type)
LRIVGAGGFSAVAALAIMMTFPGTDEHVRWLAYTTLVVAQVVRAYANRSLHVPLRRLAPNGFLLGACVIVVLVQFAIPFVPALAEAFQASPLDAGEWGIVAVVALAPAIVAEVVRSLRARIWVA